MRAVLQRVTQAHVDVDGRPVGAISNGIVVLLGVSKEDTDAQSRQLLEKILYLRIFPDDEGKMNRNIQETGGSLLIISQFTLYGDCRKGRRPSFDRAAAPDQARLLYEGFVDLARRGPAPVETGEYRAHMEVHLVNDGPVTILLDTDQM